MMKRPLKFTLTILGAILLGAIGSGLWERALAPALTATTGSVVRLVGQLSHSYRDSIYREAAKGFHEEPSLFLVGSVLGALCGLTTGSAAGYYLLGRRDARAGESAGIFRSFSRHLTAILFFTSGVYLVVTTSVVVTKSWTNRVTTYSLQSIEILSPSLSEQELRSLRSQFFRVNGAGDFAKFQNELDGFSRRAKVSLPSFTPP